MTAKGDSADGRQRVLELIDRLAVRQQLPPYDDLLGLKADVLEAIENDETCRDAMVEAGVSFTLAAASLDRFLDDEEDDENRRHYEPWEDTDGSASPFTQADCLTAGKPLTRRPTVVSCRRHPRGYRAKKDPRRSRPR